MSEIIYFIGIDIGGTKCTVSISTLKLKIIHRIQFATHTEKGPEYAIKEILNSIDEIKTKIDFDRVKIIGISCGGPLNSKSGIVLSPPNLPGWDNIQIVKIIVERCPTIRQMVVRVAKSNINQTKWGSGGQSGGNNNP